MAHRYHPRRALGVTAFPARFTLRLADSELAAAKANATALGVGLSSYLRSLIGAEDAWCGPGVVGKRLEHVGFAMTEDEERRLGRLAAVLGIPRSEYIRNRIK